MTAWLTIVSICLLGALSPGPSLAVVLKHTLASGRQQGMMAGIAHGLGVGLYAFICISGVAVVIVTSARLFTLMQWIGAGYLFWLGVKAFLPKKEQPHQHPDTYRHRAASEGFLIVFFNPKIALFFIALFSQVVGFETSILEKVLYASTAMIIDGLWYVIVAWLFSNPRWLKKLHAHTQRIERLFGAVLIGLAGKLALGLL